MPENIHMADNVTWQAERSGDIYSVFPEERLHLLAKSGVDKALTNASPSMLADRLGQKVGVRGEHGVVREVKGHPDLVVKVSELPFSYSAINVALEAGFKGRRHKTPNYLGIMTVSKGAGLDAQHRTATVMTRAPGVPLAEALSFQPSDEESEAFANDVRLSGNAALARVNIDPSLVSWDPNHNNFFVSRRNIALDEAIQEPITIIDQNAGLNLGVREWEAAARSGFHRDPRDIKAEQGEAGADAWQHFVNNQAA